MAITLQEIKGDRNIKGVNLEYWGGLEGFLAATSNGSGGSSSVQTLRRVVPWLAKATTMTANAVADLPFEILNDKNAVVDSSLNWKNKLGGIPDPCVLFYKLASSLCLGRAYATFQKTSNLIIDIQYFAPQSITPQINYSGIQYFDRASDKGNTDRYWPVSSGKTENLLLYFWIPDSDVELGPALSFPAGTALMACELMFSMDGSIKTYADRGFIPATILGVKGMADVTERQRTESWFNRFLRGFTKEPAKVINSEAMTVNKLGGGMDELSGIYKDLNKQSIENIGTAFGIPAALFMSDMAFASEVNPMIKIWYTTSQFKLIYQTIENTFNTQLLNQFNLHLRFKPETLDAFKDEQLDNQQAFSGYVASGIKHSVAAQMAGLKLPDGITPDMLDPEEKEEVIPAPVVAPVIEPKDDEEDDQEEMPKSLNSKQIKELALWNQISTRCFKKNKGNAIDFECKDITADMADDIRVKLRKARTIDDISKAFETGVHDETVTVYSDDGLKALASAINRATDTDNKAPIFNYTAPNISLTAQMPEVGSPGVTINIPDQPAPIVNVTSPEVKVYNDVNPTPVTIENNIQEPEKTTEKLKVIRDAKGQITGMEKK